MLFIIKRLGIKVTRNFFSVSLSSSRVFFFCCLHSSADLTFLVAAWAMRRKFAYKKVSSWKFQPFLLSATWNRLTMSNHQHQHSCGRNFFFVSFSRNVSKVEKEKKKVRKMMISANENLVDRKLCIPVDVDEPFTPSKWAAVEEMQDFIIIEVLSVSLCEFRVSWQRRTCTSLHMHFTQKTRKRRSRLKLSHFSRSQLYRICSDTMKMKTAVVSVSILSILVFALDIRNSSLLLLMCSDPATLFSIFLRFIFQQQRMEKFLESRWKLEIELNWSGRRRNSNKE